MNRIMRNTPILKNIRQEKQGKHFICLFKLHYVGKYTKCTYLNLAAMQQIVDTYYCQLCQPCNIKIFFTNKLT